MSADPPFSRVPIVRPALDTAIGYGRLLRALLPRRRHSASVAKDHRLLLLVREFAPAIAGGVYRPAALARYAQRAGWKVTVVTVAETATPTRAGLKLLDYVGAEVEVERIAAPRLHPSVRLFPSIDGGMITALDMVDAVRRRFNDDVPRTIVASGPPFCSFVAALLLARHRESRLVLEYRDEWTECPFDFVGKSGADARWEARCLTRADRIVVTTESQKSHLLDRFGPAAAGKCTVVANGWEPAETEGAEAEPPEKGARVVLTFAGKLGGHTDPSRFLGALEGILARREDLRSKVTIRLVGRKRADVEQRLQEFGFKEVLDLVPVVPLAEAARLMRASDALLLFHDPRFERYIPGKLYEYAASGTPVLLMDDVGESTRLVRKFSLGWSVKTDDDAALEAVLDRLVQLHAQNSPAPPERATDLVDWLRAHTREALARRFLTLLD